jgi:hypothetical protein
MVVGELGLDFWVRERLHCMSVEHRDFQYALELERMSCFVLWGGVRKDGGFKEGAKSQKV